ncbi:MAG TPA: hypothetical protein QF423_05515, partial [Candidatus Scalindua sp.]|nr:hypothetical protein [Candidatus Scalindua sp.]
IAIIIMSGFRRITSLSNLRNTPRVVSPLIPLLATSYSSGNSFSRRFSSLVTQPPRIAFLCPFIVQ